MDGYLNPLWIIVGYFIDQLIGLAAFELYLRLKGRR